jgi:hypothetical protein
MTSWKITWRLPRRKERKSVKAKACTKAQRRKRTQEKRTSAIQGEAGSLAMTRSQLVWSRRGNKEKFKS